MLSTLIIIIAWSIYNYCRFDIGCFHEELTDYESDYPRVTHLHIAVPIITRSYATCNPRSSREKLLIFRYLWLFCTTVVCCYHIDILLFSVNYLSGHWHQACLHQNWHSAWRRGDSWKVSLYTGSLPNYVYQPTLDH